MRETAVARGLRVIIAGAGGAAHLPGMVAAKTVVPVLGVPIPATALQGMDSLLSIVQMPKGVPVGTLAIGAAGAANAGLLAAQILATTDAALQEKMSAWRAARRDEVLATRAARRRLRGAADEHDGTRSRFFPGATIGIFGGGQLGRMTAMAARAMGYRIQVLDPDPACRRALWWTRASRPTGTTHERRRTLLADATW